MDELSFKQSQNFKDKQRKVHVAAVGLFFQLGAWMFLFFRDGRIQEDASVHIV
jgi:hypothetical protein